ncbi:MULTISPECIES: hypothetical protein [Kitasatospora]|uniref:hypothetical protein n=1 Tax=Kitasatospora albolonga TaxID=68173 RepID=UPI0031EA16BA
MDDAWTAEQAGWYRIGPGGQEFLGLERPDGAPHLEGEGLVLELNPGDTASWHPGALGAARADDAPARTIPWDHSYDND